MFIRRKLIVVMMVVFVALAGCNRQKPAQNTASQPSSSTTANPTPMNPGSTTRTPPPSGAGIVPPPPVTVTTEGNSLSLAGITFDLPEGWVKENPTSSMRLAQYTLPGEAGTAELIVFYFGPGQGGSADANITRWAGQFKDSQGEPQISRFEQGGLKLSIVRVTGTYAPSSMGAMMPAPPPQSDSALFGLIVEGGPKGSLFIRSTGPKATMEAQDALLEAFARSAQLAE